MTLHDPHPSRMTPSGTSPARILTLCLMAGALTLPAGQASAMECVTFVKQQLAKSSPSQDFSVLTGAAGTWFKSAKSKVGSKAVSAKPAAGYIMVFAGSGDKASFPSYASFAAGKDGHVALVRSVSGSSTIYVDHANWRAGVTDTNVKVTTGDSWTTASVFNKNTGAMGGGRYAVAGFINPAAFPKKKK